MLSQVLFDLKTFERLVAYIYRKQQFGEVDTYLSFSKANRAE